MIFHLAYFPARSHESSFGMNIDIQTETPAPILIIVEIDLSNRRNLTMSDQILDIQDDQFEQKVLRQSKPVVVDFWAPWCGPCKAMAPMFQALAESYGDRVVFSKCNVDVNQAVSSRCSIRAIPTLLIFNKGKVVHSITGLVSRGALEKAIKNVLTGKATPSPFTVN
jgi:thioredoxin 1